MYSYLYFDKDGRRIDDIPSENDEYFYCLFNINTNKAVGYAEVVNFDFDSIENCMILNNMIFNNNRAPVVLEDNP